MKFRQHRLIETRAVSIEIEGADARPVPYSHSGRTYRPDLLVATWERTDGGAWETRSVALYGPTLLKGGGDSKNRQSERFWSYNNHPEWITALLATNQPDDARAEESR